MNTRAQRLFCTRYRKQVAPPNQKIIKKWHQTLLEIGSWEAVRRIQTPTVERVVVINHYMDNLRQPLKRVAACFDISVSAVRSALENVEMKCYHSKVSNKHCHKMRICLNSSWQNKEFPNPWSSSCFPPKQCFASIEK